MVQGRIEGSSGSTLSTSGVVVTHKSPNWERAKIAGITIAVTAFVIGLIGLLAHLQILQVGLAGVGVMSSATGLYVTLAGFGTTFIASILLIVGCLVQRSKEPNYTLED